MTINYSSYLSTLSKVTSSADTGFKSVFLDKYDNHFNAAQLNFFTNQFSRIFQNFSPDVINPRVKTKLKLGQTAFISEAPLLGLNALGLVHPTSPKKKVVLKFIYQLLCENRQFKISSVSSSQRLYGNGYMLSGRYSFNQSKGLRFGHYTRVCLWTQNAKRPSWYPRGVSGFVGSRGGDFVAGGSLVTGSFFRSNKGHRLTLDIQQYKTISYIALLSTTTLRTVWYQTNSYLNRFKPTSAAFDQKRANHCFQTSVVSKLHGILKLTGFLFKKRFSVFGTKGDWLRSSIDSQLGRKTFRHRKYLRHRTRRIAIGRYECKLWGYKKTRFYWRYMRWVSRFYFRGFAYLRLFTMRIDVFIINHLRVSSIIFSRLLVAGGHAFIGDSACKNAGQYVITSNVVSLSYQAYKWALYGSGNTKWKDGYTARATNLSFSRSSNLGYLRDYKQRFVVPYGDFLDVLNAGSRFRFMSRWSSLGYFQGQWVIRSAWW